MLSDGSVARTSKVCVPSARAEYVVGDVQGTKAARLRRHSKVEPLSLEEKVKVADVLDVVPVGPDVIVVFGGVESVLTVQLTDAGVASVLSAASVARTKKVCGPLDSPE